MLIYTTFFQFPLLTELKGTEWNRFPSVPVVFPITRELNYRSIGAWFSAFYGFGSRFLYRAAKGGLSR